MAECAYRGVDCFGAEVKCLETPTVAITRHLMVGGEPVELDLESCEQHSRVVGLQVEHR